jgi:hypothetical protein
VGPEKKAAVSCPERKATRSMMKDESAAREVSELVLSIGAQLDHSIELIASRCTPGEYDAYRQSVGRIMGEILVGVLNPVYKQHPKLKPPRLDELRRIGRIGTA